jgi:hypothetical protein
VCTVAERSEGKGILHVKQANKSGDNYCIACLTIFADLGYGKLKQIINIQGLGTSKQRNNYKFDLPL